VYSILNSTRSIKANKVIEVIMLEDVSVVESVSSMAYEHRRPSMQNKLIHNVVTTSLFVKRFTIYKRLFFLFVDSLAISYKEQTHADDFGYSTVNNFGEIGRLNIDPYSFTRVGVFVQKSLSDLNQYKG
jgi:hypothetical protein